MLQPKAEGRKATRLRCGDERAACTCQSEPARGCVRHSAAPVSLISQPHLPETPGGPPEKKKKKKKKSLKFVAWLDYLCGPGSVQAASVAASRLPLIGLSEQDGAFIQI